MVIKLLSEGHEVVVWNRSKERISNFKLRISNFKYKDNLTVAQDIRDLFEKLSPPRIVWLMLPAHSTSSGSETGDPTQDILDEVEKYVDADDVIIDGGNAFFEDTERRYGHFRKKSVKFLGIGVSGGVIAARAGYPFMAGGEPCGYY